MKYYRPLNRNHMKKPAPAWHIVLVIGVAIAIILASAASKACDEIYFKVGTGYKFSETDQLKMEDGSMSGMKIHSPISARFELGKQSGNWSYGVAHHSNWFVGAPFNDKGEYAKSELFIDYKWSWK